MEIIKTDNYKIYKFENSIYRIIFNYTSYALVNSIVRTKIIVGSSTDEYYKTITFKAESVKPLKQYLHDYEAIIGKKTMLLPDIVKMLQSLVKQLNYLLKTDFSTIIGYNPEEIIVINDTTFAFLGSELVANFDVDTEMAMISCPFSSNDFFFSPEMLQIKTLPAYIHYKTSYFSLACLIIYLLLGNNEFYIDYLKHKEPLKIVEELNNHHVKDSKIYWLLSRCLDEESKNRSIILI